MQFEQQTTRPAENAAVPTRQDTLEAWQTLKDHPGARIVNYSRGRDNMDDLLSNGITNKSGREAVKQYVVSQATDEFKDRADMIFNTCTRLALEQNGAPDTWKMVYYNDRNPGQALGQIEFSIPLEIRTALEGVRAKEVAGEKYVEKREVLKKRVDKTAKDTNVDTRFVGISGDYVIGDAEKFVKIVPGGKDFFRLTSAKTITVIDRKYKEQDKTTRKAEWDGNQYNYADGTKEKVMFLNGHQYNIHVDSVDTAAKEKNDTSSKIEALRGTLTNSLDMLVTNVLKKFDFDEAPPGRGKIAKSYDDVRTGAIYTKKTVRIAQGLAITNDNADFSYPRRFTIAVPGSPLKFQVKYGKNSFLLKQGDVTLAQVGRNGTSGDAASLEKFTEQMSTVVSEEIEARRQIEADWKKMEDDAKNEKGGGGGSYSYTIGHENS